MGSMGNLHYKEGSMASLRSLIEKHYEQVANNDFAGVAELFHPDVVTVEPGAGTIHGLAAFTGYMAAFHSAFPDGRLNLKTAVESGDTIIVEGSFTGTNTGPMMGPGGEMPATGRALDLPYCDVFEVRDGKIVAHRVYYDQVAFMKQLGLMP